jgi:putative transposase
MRETTLLADLGTSVFSAVRNLFVPPVSQRQALSTHLHRLAAFAR